MRHLIAGFLVGAAIVNPSTDQPSPPSRLNLPVEGAFTVAAPMARGVCGVWRTIEQIARRTRIRVGVQNSVRCPPGGAGLDPADSAIDLQGFSPRAAFDYLVKLRPEFSWREIDDVAVFRPVEAWDAPTDSLSRPVTPFRSENAHPHYALHAMLENTQPVMFQAHTDLELSSLGRRRFDPSATAFDGIWQVGYTGTFMHIEVRTLDIQEGSTLITAAVRRLNHIGTIDDRLPPRGADGDESVCQNPGTRRRGSRGAR
jgi:hypothetical protein